MRILPLPPRGEQTRAAFDAFVAAHTDGLLRTAYLITWDLAEAEDLVQECLLAVARRWPRVKAMDHPRAYARRILVNLALDDAPRRTRRRRELADDTTAGLIATPPDEADEAGARAFDDVDARAELLQALSMLAPRQRAVLVLRYFEDLTEAQAAAALGCSVGTVKSTSARALARLSDVMTDKEHTR